MKTKTLTTKELAMQFFPNSTPRSAVTQLKRWIVINQPLARALEKSGYIRGQRIFTPLQVALVYDYLGDPN